MEMAFAGEEEVMHKVEMILKTVWSEIANVHLGKQVSFPRMTYQEAMASYGSDKPDLRIGAKVCLSS